MKIKIPVAHESPCRDQSLSSLAQEVWRCETVSDAVKRPTAPLHLFTRRRKGAIKNHLFAAICGFVQLQKLSAMALINNCYSLQRNLFNDVIASFIGTFMPSMAHLNPEFQPVVNA